MNGWDCKCVRGWGKVDCRANERKREKRGSCYLDRIESREQPSTLMEARDRQERRWRGTDGDRESWAGAGGAADRQPAMDGRPTGGGTGKRLLVSLGDRPCYKPFSFDLHANSIHIWLPVPMPLAVARILIRSTADMWHTLSVQYTPCRTLADTRQRPCRSCGRVPGPGMVRLNSPGSRCRSPPIGISARVDMR